MLSLYVYHLDDHLRIHIYLRNQSYLVMLNRMGISEALAITKTLSEARSAMLNFIEEYELLTESKK